MLAVSIERDAIRIGERFRITFQRTLRIPHDGRAYALPPGLGRLPILPVADYADRVPALWREQGGAFIPMRQSEALWLGFHAAAWKPNAVKIAVGGVNALTGRHDDSCLQADPQDYLVCPNQPWIDGIHTGDGSIRQFVPLPLRLSRSAAAAIAGAEPVECLQITVFEPNPGRFPDEPPIRSDRRRVATAVPRPDPVTTGLGAGAIMSQKIYPDSYGVDTWEQANQGRVLVHIVNSDEFCAITGREAPITPIDASTYTRYGLPWLDVYDESTRDSWPCDTFTAGISSRVRAEIFAC